MVARPDADDRRVDVAGKVLNAVSDFCAQAVGPLGGCRGRQVPVAEIADLELRQRIQRFQMAKLRHSSTAHDAEANWLVRH